MISYLLVQPSLAVSQTTAGGAAREHWVVLGGSGRVVQVCDEEK